MKTKTVVNKRRLRLPQRQSAHLTILARKRYPYEACGLLLGTIVPVQTRGNPGSKRRTTQVEQVLEADNLERDRGRGHDRYLLDPVAFVRADEVARNCGLEILGIWHTHPDHPARPSETDRQAAWPDYSYLIASVDDRGAITMRSWSLDGESFVEELIEEIPS